LPEKQLHIAIIGINIDCRKKEYVFSTPTVEKMAGTNAIVQAYQGCLQIVKGVVE
jgi:hypothetical protein